MAQKLVIPRGIINPEETTVINIPNNLRGSSVVVAQKSTPGTPTGAGAQSSFYTPPPRGYEHPSLDYPAYMDESSELNSYYRITEAGENWNKSWGPMPPRRPPSPSRPPTHVPEGAPAYPIDYWSPTKRSTPCYKPGFTTQDLNLPRPQVFPDEPYRDSPIVSRMQTMASTIRPVIPEFPDALHDPFAISDMSGSDEEEEEDIEEEEKEAEEEEAERLHALDQLEFVENDTLVQDLLALQRERRKVIYDMANMEPKRKSSLRKLLAPLKALKKLKKKLKKKNKVAPM
nr:uncharacterized protein LOC111503396 [Leptinotarsa decemlineata]